MAFNEAQLNKLDELYSQYNDTIKDLLADIESRYEALPTPIHNELRAFTDHIARCYVPGVTEADIDNELRKASGHIKRTIFDCFKFLNVKLSDFHKEFERKTKSVDLSSISNGTFYTPFCELVAEAKKTVKKAKKFEANTRSHDEAFVEYEKAYQIYVKLEELINQNITNVNWARKKYRIFTLGKIIINIALFIIGVIFTLIIEDSIKDNCVNISTIQCIKNQFAKTDSTSSHK